MTGPTLIRCNFCNLTDSTNRPIFSSCLAAQPVAMQDEWIALEKAAGGTHYTFSIESGYHDMYGDIINFFDAGRMDEWLTTLDRVLAANLIPIVMLTAGNDYPGADYLKRLVASIPSSYYPKCIWVCGWETVAYSWSSNEYHKGNLALREALGPDAIMGCHLTPGRASFSSNPVEPDDPWQGDEIACWHEKWGPNGHPFGVFMYQSPVPKQGDEIDVNAPESWGERAKEVADRFLGLPGAPDWFAGIIRPTLVWFEASAYSFIRGQSDSAWAIHVADSVKPLGYQGFGNGLPSGSVPAPSATPDEPPVIPVITPPVVTPAAPQGTSGNPRKSLLQKILYWLGLWR